MPPLARVSLRFYSRKGRGEMALMVPFGAKAYVALSGENVVAVIDLKSLEVTANIATRGPDGLAWGNASNF